MTGRDIIHGIVGTVHELDAELPILIMHRDAHSAVERKERAMVVNIINGKLYIEARGLRDEPPM